jgi:hypothetical protein
MSHAPRTALSGIKLMRDAKQRVLIISQKVQNRELKSINLNRAKFTMSIVPLTPKHPDNQEDCHKTP